ncbi:MAG: hypothetical protein CO188_13195, partial [Zetaproteobacteria bacterium CG_4_9_14_3_um_filter_54_145]
MGCFRSACTKQHTNTIFHQIIRTVPRHLFDQVAQRYNGDKR